MARGWESKEIESQIEAAEQRKLDRSSHLTQADIERLRHRESLELSKARVLHDLDAATHPRRREQLESALQYLEEQLADLDK